MGRSAAAANKRPVPHEELGRVHSESRESVATTWRLPPVFLAWTIAGLFVHLLMGYGVSDSIVQLLLGSAGLAHSAVGFWSHGGRRLTAPNLYLFSTGLFVFFPAIYLIDKDPISFGQADIIPAVSVAYFVQVFVYHVFWANQDEGVPVSAQALTDSRVSTWGVWTSLAMVIGGVALRLAGVPDSVLVNATIFSGVALLSVASLRRSGRVRPGWYLLVTLAFLAYATFAFSGFGRLQLGALALCIALAASHRWPGRSVKFVILAATGPTLTYFAASRAAFTAALNPAQAATVSGLESVVSPLVRFSQLIELARSGDLQPTYLRSIFATATFWVPRELWPDKPIGLGAELAHFFSPELDGTGHSEAALFYGEWVFAVGLAGLVMMVPAIGLLVRWMDSLLRTAEEMVIRDRGGLLKVVAIIIACASLADLVWGGTFSFGVRVGTRIGVLVALYALAGWAPWSRRRAGTTARGGHAGAPRLRRRLRRQPLAVLSSEESRSSQRDQ